jgi:hypothetical protein
MYANDFAAAAGLFIPPPCSRLSSIQFSGQLGLQR